MSSSKRGQKQDSLPPYSPPHPQILRTNIEAYGQHNARAHNLGVDPPAFEAPMIPLDDQDDQDGLSRRIWALRRLVILETALQMVTSPVSYVASPIRRMSGGRWLQPAPAPSYGDSRLDAVAESSLVEPQSVFGGPIVAAPEPAGPPPPSYNETLKPIVLILEGGGMRTVVETRILWGVMNRIGWDLGMTSAQPARMPGGEYRVPPKDCFDWVASCGCASIIAFAIACGMDIKLVQQSFIKLAPALRSGAKQAVWEQLESFIPIAAEAAIRAAASVANRDFGTAAAVEASMVQARQLQDGPSLINVWLPAESNVKNEKGVIVVKGQPLKERLLPLVMREISKELDGTAEVLDCTDPFLREVFPVHESCGFVLSLGSGEVSHTVDDAGQQGWWDWLTGQQSGSGRPPLPKSGPYRRSIYIPASAYKDPMTFMRFTPNLRARRPSNGGGTVPVPVDDWTTDVTPLLTMTQSYIEKGDVEDGLNRTAKEIRKKVITRPRAPIGEASGSRTQP